MRPRGAACNSLWHVDAALQACADRAGEFQLSAMGIAGRYFHDQYISAITPRGYRALCRYHRIFSCYLTGGI